mmetsp:Transcript_7738/g.28061  ORF Transcript_7738/g.28061 Transcript_7738/m.28061 type:complete len:361 (+) Transcript_7738:44-1126(+)
MTSFLKPLKRWKTWECLVCDYRQTEANGQTLEEHCATRLHRCNEARRLIKLHQHAEERTPPGAPPARPGGFPRGDVVRRLASLPSPPACPRRTRAVAGGLRLRRRPRGGGLPVVAGVRLPPGHDVRGDQRGVQSRPDHAHARDGAVRPRRRRGARRGVLHPAAPAAARPPRGRVGRPRRHVDADHELERRQLEPRRSRERNVLEQQQGEGREDRTRPGRDAFVHRTRRPRIGRDLGAHDGHAGLRLRGGAGGGGRPAGEGPVHRVGGVAGRRLHVPRRERPLPGLAPPHEGAGVRPAAPPKSQRQGDRGEDRSGEVRKANEGTSGATGTGRVGGPPGVERVLGPGRRAGDGLSRGVEGGG